MLADIVSKNGNLLLNFPLKPDGTLDDESMQVVMDVGRWMSINGEAIYDTRPWKIFGEGPVRSGGGHFNEDKMSYSSADFRFTTKDDALYAIGMEWPGNGSVTIKSLAAGSELFPYEIGRVQLLGSSEHVDWTRSESGLTVELKGSKVDGFAFVLKIFKAF